MKVRCLSSFPVLGSFTYAYVDQTSRLSSVTYPGSTGMVTNYSYFGNIGDQRLQEIKNLKGGANMSDFQYTYNPVGTIASWKLQADANTPTQYALTYDMADQLTSAVQTLTGSSTTISSNQYNYDPAGNRLLETTVSGTTGGQFNNLNQLTALGSASSQTIAGNTSAPITSLTVNAVPASISNSTNFSANVSLPNGTNAMSLVAQPTGTSTPVTTQRFQIVTSGTIPTLLTYDANGNCTQDENGNKYTWDALNRLMAIVYPGGTHTEFSYDGLSRRTQILERAGTTIGSGTIASTKNYLWIGSEIAEERDASNNVTKRFFPQGEQQSGTPYYYTRDHLGSVREMLNSSGTIVARYAYDPYGKVTLVSGGNLATMQYAGMYLHLTSGLCLTLGNTYDASMGRWLGRDPWSEGASLNLYQYCFNDPVDSSDPFGFACEKEEAAVKAAKQSLSSLQAQRRTLLGRIQNAIPSMESSRRAFSNSTLVQLYGELSLLDNVALKAAAQNVFKALEALAECRRKNPPGGGTPCPVPAPTPAPSSSGAKASPSEPPVPPMPNPSPSNSDSPPDWMNQSPSYPPKAQPGGGNFQDAWHWF